MLRGWPSLRTSTPVCNASGRDITLIAVYVDDVLIASRSQNEINRMSKFLSQQFTIRKLGKVQQCLGIEFNCKKDSITMSQRSYIWEILRRFGMSDCNSVSTPLDPSQKLKKETDKFSNSSLPYRELVGCLTYLASSTRPDIAFSASYLGFNNCFNESHWKTAKRVLRYLKRTMNLDLAYRPDSKPLTVIPTRIGGIVL